MVSLRCGLLLSVAVYMSVGFKGEDTGEPWTRQARLQPRGPPRKLPSALLAFFDMIGSTAKSLGLSLRNRLAVIGAEGCMTSSISCPPDDQRPGAAHYPPPESPNNFKWLLALGVSVNLTIRKLDDRIYGYISIKTDACGRIYAEAKSTLN